MPQTSEEVSAVRRAHVFDEAALARYLETHVEGYRGSLTVRQFKGGQSNPTFMLEAGGRRYVLRKKPPGKLLASAHQVDREYRVMRALAGSGVPVPAMLALCEDDDVIGAAFYVMEFVDGRIFRDARLPDLSAAERAAVYDHMNEVLTRLHQIDYAAIGLTDFGKPGNYIARQINRWTTQYRAAQTGTIEPMEHLIAWLPAHLPAGDETCIAHGDFRLENTICHPTEPHIVAVLDWELATLGHPLPDLAYNCLPYHIPTAELGSLVGTDLASAGIPTEQEYVAAYCRRAGRDGISDWSFYLAFALFRLASIVQGVYKRALDGNASSDTAAAYGDATAALAALGWSMIDA
jgi:aminoglycoside phosphotransferase (APT) family kinase protein